MSSDATQPVLVDGVRYYVQKEPELGWTIRLAEAGDAGPDAARKLAAASFTSEAAALEVLLGPQ